MKKYGMIAMGLGVLTLTACGQDNAKETSGEPSDGRKKQETYTVATDNNYVPFEYLDVETNELVGFDIDLMKALAEEVGFEVEFIQTEFSGAVAGVKEGQYDIAIAGMTITEERAKNIDFSNPYYEAGLVLGVLEGNDDIQSIEDVDETMKVGTRQGTTSQTYLKKNTNAEVVAYPEIVEAYQSLLNGYVDAVLYDLPNVVYYSKEKANGKIKVVGDRLTGEDYGIAFTKGSELVEPVNEALEKLMENGTYGDIYEKYFGERPEGM